MTLSPGTRLGSDEITAQIGVGGMGEVYSATDMNLKRQVALKVLPEALAADVDRPRAISARSGLLASLNQVKVLDFGLAKAIEPVAATSSNQSLSPTITTPAMTRREAFSHDQAGWESDVELHPV